jgi:hypothetical protein
MKKKIETVWIDAGVIGSMLGMSASMVRVHIRAGKFKTASKKWGTRWVVDEAEVKAIVDGKVKTDFSGSWGKVYGKEN